MIDSVFVTSNTRISKCANNRLFWFSLPRRILLLFLIIFNFLCMTVGRSSSIYMMFSVFSERSVHISAATNENVSYPQPILRIATFLFS